jgi:phosphoribosylglycinamide formyltransferase-1
MIHLALFASGTGSNARKIIEYFDKSASVRVAWVVSNKRDAGVLHIASEHNIPVQVIEREEFFHTENLLSALKERRIDFIVLAGFLWLVPAYLVRAFPKRIVNIHPALLPKFGGKGMYGMHVHEAVKANCETETGITIHYVNERYDEGAVIFQAKCSVDPADTAADIARKVQQLEHRYFPEVIGNLLKEMKFAS